MLGRVASWRPMVEGVRTSWWQSPIVLAEVRRRTSGHPERTELEWLHLRTGQRQFRHALILGSGSGKFERTLLNDNIAARATCVEIDPEAIQTAEQEAAKCHLQDRATYIQADLNTWTIPANTFDLIFGGKAVHHIEKLERLFEQVFQGLTPDGVFFMWEYMGPSRFQYTEQHLLHTNRLLRALSDRHRLVPAWGENKVRQIIARPPKEHIAQADPSEAVRSEEILPLLRSSKLNLLETRPYGCGIYFTLLSGLIASFQDDNPFDSTILRLICEYDAVLTDYKILPALFHLILVSRDPAHKLQPVDDCSRTVEGTTIRVPVKFDWAEDLIVEKHLRRIATGHPHASWAEWFRTRYLSQPLGRCLLVGKNLSKEEWARAQIAQTVDHVDSLGQESTATAYDLVVFEQLRPGQRESLENGDLLKRSVAKDGLLFVLEDTTDQLFEWSDRRLEIANRLLAVLSPNYRQFDTEPIAGIAGPLPTETPPMQSSQIGQGFHLLEKRPAGGGLLVPLLSAIGTNLADPDGQEILRLFCVLDDILTRERVIEPVRTVSVLSAVPRPDLNLSPFATVVGKAADGNRIGVRHDQRSMSSDEALLVYAAMHRAHGV